MLPSVVRAYLDEGHVVRLGSPRLLVSGVQPAGDRRYVPNGEALPATDWGFTLRDFYAFELIGRELRPSTGLIIGNAYGISAIALGAALEPISLDVIDAELCGEDSRRGADLTRRVARRLGLDLNLETGFSPRDLDGACRHERYDLVFVDGDHTNAQMIADYHGIVNRMADRAAIVFHDVGLWALDDAWGEVRRHAEPLGFTGHDLTFTDFGTTVLLRGLPELDAMFRTTCPGLREQNESYHVGRPGEAPERAVCFVPEGRRIAFYGAGNDLGPYRSFIERHPEAVVAILDDDPAAQGTSRFGIPIIAPERLPELDVHAVIVSTNAHELAVRVRLATLAPGIRVEPGAATYPGRGLPGPIELHVQPTRSTTRNEPARPAEPALATS